MNPTFVQLDAYNLKNKVNEVTVKSNMRLKPDLNCEYI